MKLTRTELWTRNGFTMTNPRWSWYGVNHDTKSIVFQVWLDHQQGDEYVFLDWAWFKDDTNAKNRNQNLKALELLHNGYQLRVMFAQCHDTTANPRKTKWHGQQLRLCTWRNAGGKWLAKLA